MSVTIELIKYKFGEWQAEIYVDGKFVCMEYGNSEGELLETFEGSKDLYKLLSKDIEEE